MGYRAVRGWRVRIPVAFALSLLLSRTVSLVAEEEGPPPPAIPDGEAWAVETEGTREYRGWLHAGPGVRSEVKSILSSEKGDLRYSIRVAERAKGQVVVAVGEAHWAEPGRRLMDIRIDERVVARAVDPIVVAGGRHRVGAILCEAEDVDGDGRLHVRIVASPGSPDHVTLAAGIWWIADGRLTEKEAARLLGAERRPRSDVFVPGAAVLGVTAGRLAGRIDTESDELDAFVRKLYADCVLGKLYPPQPPALPHRWFSPGGGYVGQWIWDTMFVGIAYAPLDDDATIRGVFENYWHTIDHNPEAPRGSYRYGMVPNFLKPWPPHGYSQIPILAWGCEMIWLQTDDRALIERALPYLVAFDEWYSTERDTDQDGLIEYGAYKDVGAGMLQTARYETFDLHVTLDDMEMTTHPRRGSGGKWYGNVEGVEQTCFLLMSERSIVRLARTLGKQELARRYEAIVRRRVDALQRKMWDPDARFFFSLDRDSDAKIPVRTIQGFLTLACDAATEEQAEELASQLQDRERWWSGHPVPTCALDEEKFDPRGFWRGDMWPPTTYLVSHGLNRYGHHELSRRLTAATWRLARERGVNERYDSMTGKPLGVPWLGMSCSIWSMIVENVYGVSPDFRTIRIPPGAKGRRLRLGKLTVAYPEDDVVELSSAFPRRFTVLFPPDPAGEARATVTDAGGVAVDAQIVAGGVTFEARAGQRYRVAARE